MREQAEKDYMQGMKYKDIATKYGVSINTVKSWKQRYKWDRKRTHTEPEKGAHKKKKGCTQFQPGNRASVGHGPPKGNKNALGNKGGHGGPPGNNRATKHGFFKRIFPDDEETLAIVEEIQVKSPIEILWEQIVIQYTAIARAQKLMFVKDQEDLTKVLKRTKDSENMSEREWELQHAWDKHASFLTAQSRAIRTLEQLIARYEKMLLGDLEAEEQQLRIEKLKGEIAKLKNLEGEELEDDGFLEALQGSVKEVWADGEEV